MSGQATTSRERIDVKGGHLVQKVKELIHEGNVRRIIINDSDGKQVLDMPVSVGVIGLLVAPTMTAVGALGALAADYSIEVERELPGTAEPTVTTLWSSRDIKRGEKAMSGYRELLDHYVALYNAGDLDGIMDLYSEDAVQGMPEGIFEGRSKIRERLARELAAFSDLDWGVTSFVEQGDAFADEWFFAGTHTGPFTMPDGTELPPTGKRVRVSGMELVRMRDGKIVVDNLYYDNLGIAMQLGLLPDATPAASA
jgi:predicted ester cyclase